MQLAVLLAVQLAVQLAVLFPDRTASVLSPVTSVVRTKIQDALYSVLKDENGLIIRMF